MTKPTRFARDADKQIWNDFVFTSPYASFLQSWEWGELQQELGVKFWRLIVGDWKAVALVIRRELPLGKSWLYVPRGPIGTHPGLPLSGRGISPPDKGEKEGVFTALQEKLIELAQQENALFIRIDPTWREIPPSLPLSREEQWRKSEREVQPRYTLKLDLTKSEEDLLTDMHHKTRYNIRLADRKGVTVRFSQDETDLEHFFRLAREVAERSSFHFHPDVYYRAMLKVPMVELALAEHESDVLAVHIIISAGREVTYAHGASTQRKKELMAPHLLQWETFKKAKREGLKTFDFFGITPLRSKSSAGQEAPHPWSGITRFKEGFGGYRESYMGAYDLVLEPGLYQLFHVARRVRGFISK